MFRKYFLSGLIWVIYRVISLTWRVVLIEPEDLKSRLKNRQPVVFAHWHGDEIVLLSLIGKYRIATIASTSKDGEMMNTLIHLVGGKTSRGSSTRGAVGALKGLIRLVVNEGRNCSFAVDGPKGPIYHAKPGVFELSRLAKAPIYSAGVSCDRAWRFEKSWNKTFFPKPFSRVYISWTLTLPAISKDQDPRAPETIKTLEDALHNARCLASKQIATK